MQRLDQLSPSQRALVELKAAERQEFISKLNEFMCQLEPVAAKIQQRECTEEEQAAFIEAFKIFDYHRKAFANFREERGYLFASYGIDPDFERLNRTEQEQLASDQRRSRREHLNDAVLLVDRPFYVDIFNPEHNIDMSQRVMQKRLYRSESSEMIRINLRNIYEDAKVFAASGSHKSETGFSTADSNLSRENVCEKASRSEYRRPYLKSNISDRQNEFQRDKKSQRSKKEHFTPEAEKYLEHLKMSNQNLTYPAIAQLINDRCYTSFDAKYCQYKWTRVLCPQLTKGRWSSDEDRELLRLYKENSGNITEIARYMSKRHIVQIRDRIRILMSAREY